MVIPAEPSAAGSCQPMFQCAVAAHGIVEARLADLAALREEPGGPTARRIPPRFLRHADEQTVVGLAAVLRAIQEHYLEAECFDDWGVLAAPQFPGRIVGAATLAQFQRGGPAAITPHVIPQHSLHAASSAISIVLGMRGPSFGIGGGTEALAEALCVALTFWDRGSLPGVWLVLTQWAPEPVPDGMGSSTVDSVCRGVALALVPGESRERSLRLSMQRPARPVDAATATPSCLPDASTLAEIAGFVTAKPDSDRDTCWSCFLPWGGQIELITHGQQQEQPA